MLCCIRRTKPVEKNEEADQEIKQDGTKPEENAHKAATKIQASFRGHITRKKIKDGEKEEENGDVPDECAEAEETQERIASSEEKPPEGSAENAEETEAPERPAAPAAEVPPTAPSDTPTKEEVQEQEMEKLKEESEDVNTQNTVEEEAKQADVPDASDNHQTDQIDKQETAEDSKPAEESSDAGEEKQLNNQ